jgi:acid stress-induced BolA-like protein IbaG/YrbA
MQVDQVKALLERELQGCDIAVSGDGRHFELTIVGDIFSGLRPVKQQQLVYAALNDAIASGDIHAVNMRLFTREAWAAQAP